MNKMSYSEIIHEAEELLNKYQTLLEQTEGSTLCGDMRVAKNAAIAVSQLETLITEISEFEAGRIEADREPHNLSFEEIIEAKNLSDFDLPSTVIEFRRKLTTAAYKEINKEDIADIYNLFLDYDAYGGQANAETLFLSRGVSDLNYFRPPAIVNVAIDVANNNNWFGYSHALGHAQTRQAIAEYEKIRRNHNNITEKNISVVPGGTSALNAVLSLLAKEQKNDRKPLCLSVIPTYPRYYADVQLYFDTKEVRLNEDYTLDKDKIIEAIKEGDVSVVLFSVPHNPAKIENFSEIFDEIYNVCQEYGISVVIDEITFDKDISCTINPDKYPAAITICSYSKSYDIPGVRLGHIMADKDFIKRYARHAANTYSSSSSFFYFVATTISQYEASLASDVLPKNSFLDKEDKEKIQTDNSIFREFSLWKEHAELHKKLQPYVLQKAIERHDIFSIESVYGINDPSPNIVLRQKEGDLEDTTYKTALSLFYHQNVMIIPGICFVKPADWAHEFRATLTVSPSDLVRALPATLIELDRIYAWNNIPAADREWLEKIGLFLTKQGRALQDKPYRTLLELSKSFSGVVGSIPERTLHTAVLSHLTQIWNLLDKKGFENNWRVITNDNVTPAFETAASFGKELIQIGHGLELAKIDARTQEALLKYWNRESAKDSRGSYFSENKL